ncbi:MAG TPA: tetratricopeptide repeat protein [Planctomycetes bacterium]|nr:tetratricopeptide repeat protein [Planctomycetota bacterium]
MISNRGPSSRLAAFGLVVTTAIALGACGSSAVVVLDDFGRGIERYDDGDYHGAIRYYRQALEAHPDDHRILYNLGLTYHDLYLQAKAEGDAEKASRWQKESLAAYDRCLRVDPEDSKARSAKAVLLEDLGRRDEALTLLNEDAATDGETAVIVLWTKGVLFEKAGDVAGARESFRRALEVDPHHLESSVSLADLDRRQGKLAEAETVLAKSLEVHPYSFSLLSMRARVAVERARHSGDDDALWRQAEARCKEAWAILPDHPLVNLWLADVRERKGDLEAAVAHLWRARDSRSDAGLRKLGITDPEVWRSKIEERLKGLFRRLGQG